MLRRQRVAAGPRRRAMANARAPFPLRLRGGLDELMARQVKESAIKAAEKTLLSIEHPQQPSEGAHAMCDDDWGTDNFTLWDDAPQFAQDGDLDAGRLRPMPLPRGVRWCVCLKSIVGMCARGATPGPNAGMLLPPQ